MSQKKLTLKQVDKTYHRSGRLGFSPSLVRARQPFIVTNILLGSTIALIAAGIFTYSISAVKQDDFSDIDDLLPPLEQRKTMKSIEDELREAKALPTDPSLPEFTSSPSAIAGRLPGGGVSSTSQGVWQRSTSWFTLPRRLDDLEWVRRRGWVESGKGNVLVWGAPNVDNVGKVEGTTRGPRLV